MLPPPISPTPFPSPCHTQHPPPHTGKDLEACQKAYLSRKRYFSVKEAYEEGLVDKLVPGYKLNRFRKMAKEMVGAGEGYFNKDKPTFRFKRDDKA